jgi:hypothetical protein
MKMGGKSAPEGKIALCRPAFPAGKILSKSRRILSRIQIFAPGLEKPRFSPRLQRGDRFG